MLDNVADANVRDVSFRNFLNVLRALTRVLPFPNASELYGPELGRRMLSAAQGRLGYIKPLLIGAVELAHQRDERLLSSELLEAVFTRDIWSDGVGSKNPFNPHFKFEDQLDGPGNRLRRMATGEDAACKPSILSMTFLCSRMKPTAAFGSVSGASDPAPYRCRRAKGTQPAWSGRSSR
jgi:hypothetical protein